jgi:diamine N-acetyltransferase
MTEQAGPVTLRPLDRHNWRECVRLKVRPDQDHFVASNTYSIAQSKMEPECVPLAIYAGDTMVGFLMYALDADDGDYWIYRLMIAADQQGKGYGRAAMQSAIRLMRELPGCTGITISYEPENTVAERLYESLGFRKTGQMVAGEVVQRLTFDS